MEPKDAHADDAASARVRPPCRFENSGRAVLAVAHGFTVGSMTDREAWI